MCRSEIKKIESSARDHFKRIFNDHEKLKLQLETQKRDLEVRGQELMKRETHNEIERKKLTEDLEQVLHIIIRCLICMLCFFGLDDLLKRSKYSQSCRTSHLAFTDSLMLLKLPMARVRVSPLFCLLCNFRSSDRNCSPLICYVPMKPNSCRKSLAELPVLQFLHTLIDSLGHHTFTD